MTRPRYDCTETFKRLDDYLDRELPPAEKAAVEAHLEECADCSGEFEVETELLARIKDRLAQVRVPASLMAKITARLAGM